MAMKLQEVNKDENSQKLESPEFHVIHMSYTMKMLATAGFHPLMAITEC
jgi:hypothetical protein